MFAPFLVWMRTHPHLQLMSAIQTAATLAGPPVPTAVRFLTPQLLIETRGLHLSTLILALPLLICCIIACLDALQANKPRLHFGILVNALSLVGLALQVYAVLDVVAGMPAPGAFAALTLCIEAAIGPVRSLRDAIVRITLIAELINDVPAFLFSAEDL